jgi:hypothetical protein
MRIQTLIALALVAGSAIGYAKTKKSDDAPPAFATAKSVYVEAESGDYSRPGLSPADRRAIESVQDAIRTWNRYTLAPHREKADLIFIVRKGNAGAAGGREVGAPNNNNSRTSGPVLSRDPGQAAGPDSLGVAAQASEEEDRLRVCTMGSNGKLSGSIWTREITNGLDSPGVVIVQQLKLAVERTFPALAPAPAPVQPAQ